MDQLRRWEGPFLNRPNYPWPSVRGFAPPASTEGGWTRAVARARWDCWFSLGGDPSSLLPSTQGPVPIPPGPRSSDAGLSASAFVVALHLLSSQAKWVLLSPSSR